MNKWLERAAWVTGLLSLVGAFLIIYYLTNKPVATQKIATDRSKNILKDTTAKTNEPVRDTIKKQETLPEIQVADDTIVVTKEPAKIIKVKEEKKIKVKKDDKPVRSLTRAELLKLLTRVRVNNTNNCIHIRTSTAAKNKTLARQLSSYFKKNNFILAGRSETPDKIKGIKIKREGMCNTVIIGSF